MKFHSISTNVCRVHVGLDEHNAQEWAMLGAMFSRSNEGALALVDRVQREGASGKFLEQYYVGYGHESIGDLVDVKLYVEGIPFYVAALIEHHAKFRGQESSTRYIDFNKQPCCFNADVDLYAKQIDIYKKAVETVYESIRSKHTSMVAPSPVHLRAINARTFDICRGLLPLSVTTNVAWYSDIRAIKTHLTWMKNYYWAIPYVEVIQKALYDVYPESIGDWNKVRDYYSGDPWIGSSNDYNTSFDGWLDFGSWRDLNRHRIGWHTFSLPSKGMHPWYLEMLYKNGFDYSNANITIKDDINQLILGMRSNVTYWMPEFQAEYIVKLRSKPTVHPTLRAFIEENAKADGMNHLLDDTPDPGAHGYFLQRGNDTILVKGEL